MAVTTFHGKTRWRRFRAWQKLLPKNVSVTGIGCWQNEDGVPELFIEYGAVKHANSEERKREWEQPLLGKHLHRR